jgi:hypothetical protein
VAQVRLVVLLIQRVHQALIQYLAQLLHRAAAGVAVTEKMELTVDRAGELAQIITPLLLEQVTPQAQVHLKEIMVVFVLLLELAAQAAAGVHQAQELTELARHLAQAVLVQQILIQVHLLLIQQAAELRPLALEQDLMEQQTQETVDKALMEAVHLRLATAVQALL